MNTKGTILLSKDEAGWTLQIVDHLGEPTDSLTLNPEMFKHCAHALNLMAEQVRANDLH